MNWLIALLSGHSSYITHLDWSEDSQYIRSNSGDYEVLFCECPYNVRERNNVSPGDFCGDDTRHSLGGPTTAPSPSQRWASGLNPPTEPTSTPAPGRMDCRLAATGDDFGKVKLYAYPVTQPKSLCHQHAGHAAHVTSVRFLHDSNRLLSAGGRDAALAQWLVD
ncbi:hypothetical protein ACJJTC_016868 [Scirpophaga incertulas]